MTPILLNIAHFKQPEIEYIASILFNTMSVNQTDSRDVLLEKYKALESFRSFLTEHIHFDMLPDKKSKLQYAEFATKLNQQIEELELLSGLITQEELDVIAKRFAKKWEFPVGIYDE